MSRLTPVVVLLALGLAAAPARAKASYLSLEALVVMSDLVAVIEVISSTSLDASRPDDLPRRGHWRYRQRSAFRIVAPVVDAGLVARDAGPQTLLARKLFICASATYAPGRYLAFLESSGRNEWVTLNHHLGALRIDDEGRVPDLRWYLRSEKSPEDAPAPSLETARARIRQVLRTGSR